MLVPALVPPSAELERWSRKINHGLSRMALKFVADHVPGPPAAIPAIRHYFKAYVTSVAGARHH